MTSASTSGDKRRSAPIDPTTSETPVAVSILIVNYNGGPLLARCVASLSAAADSLSFEAIVVDNASTDDSLQQLAQLPAAPWLTLIRRADNAGFAAATNQAAAIATTKRRPQSSMSEYRVVSSLARALASCGISTTPRASPSMAVGNSISRSA